MKKITFMVLAAFLFFAACKKEKGNPISANGVVLSVNDGTGCGFVINLDNGSKIEPINATADHVKNYMVNNKRVSVVYRLNTDFITPCQNASAAVVDEISDTTNR